MEHRNAQYGCPMCGYNKETRGNVDIDGGYMAVDYTCERCGIKYTILYSIQYSGFYMGNASWDENGDLTPDE